MNCNDGFSKYKISCDVCRSRALAAIGTTTTTAFAQDTPPGIANQADENVHENTGPVSKQDVAFHTGLCQAGITTDALEGLGGCDILGSPGQSDDVRQD